MFGSATWWALARGGRGWVAFLGIWILGGCGPTLSEQDVAEAVSMLDQFERGVHRQDYDTAVAFFTDTVQQRIHRVGGGPTPLAGFFAGLEPKIEKRTRHRLSRGTIWVTYTYDGDQEMHIALARFPDGWRIARIIDVDWSV